MDAICGSGINSQNRGCVLLYIIPCINSQVQHQVQPDDILNDIPLWASLRFIWGSTCPEVSSFRADSLEDVLIVYIGHQ